MSASVADHFVVVMKSLQWGWSEGGGVLSGFQRPICVSEDETLDEANYLN